MASLLPHHGGSLNHIFLLFKPKCLFHQYRRGFTTEINNRDLPFNIISMS